MTYSRAKEQYSPADAAGPLKSKIAPVKTSFEQNKYFLAPYTSRKVTSCKLILFQKIVTLII